MTMFDSIANVNDYLSEHWLAEVFPSKLKDLSVSWKELAAKGKETPVRGLAALNGAYLTELASLPERSDPEFIELVTQTHQTLLRAVGFDASPVILETTQAETPMDVPLLGRFSSPTSADALHILQVLPVDSVDAMLGDDAHLLTPITLAVSSEKAETLTAVSKAITQIFVSDDPPRYLLVVAGSAVLVTDAARWSEGRYLGFDVATALDRRDDRAIGELAFHAGLWSADVLLPNDDGKATLDAFTEDSEKHAVGVSEDLREGLRISIEKIANEVLDQRRAHGSPVEGIPELPRDLTTQSLRFLYRILFLLFAEARPELGILPVGAPEYGSGYGLDRLREIIQGSLTGASANGHHLHDSLNLLFRLVNEGHNFHVSDSDGLVFEPLRSDLFDPERTPLIDDSKLSNHVLQEVLTLLLLSKPSKNKNKQRGYISYAQLGINQLGAVYEGLMSYSGLIAQDDVIEVAKDGNADKGSWLVPSTKSGDYDEKDLVWREDRLTGRKDIVRHAKGNFVFRLSGRDRQRSASYYTPEVLTKTVVKHALAELITRDTTAQDILEYRICEPALGSGAFLNEAINQLAAEYLTRRQDELGHRIDPEKYATELQKVKAYIALHRAYGVDLNSTAVELAEVSLWLNVMHRGLQAPWFGLHLRRGNSLVGARRSTYDFTSLGRAKKSWLKTPPTDRPLSHGAVGDGEIHHFLLPAGGWGAVADAKQAKELAPESAAAMKKWRSEIVKKPSSKQIDRLRALARRVERLWELSLRRLTISEREIARQIDVWGAGIEPVAEAVSREAVESELFDPEGPYMRLRLVMDAWCALWFWPLASSVEDVDEARHKPPSLDEWILTLEGLLGADGLKKGIEGQSMFHEALDSFKELSKLDEMERQFSGMKPVWRLVAEHPWLGFGRDIAAVQGFFHWELDYAGVFHRGGFDLQVGNPPWVRPDWWESTALAETDPYFLLQEKIADKAFKIHRSKVLSSRDGLALYLGDLAIWAGNAAHLGSSVEHSVLAGIRTNLYMNFIERAWRNSQSAGIAALLHPEGHFSDPNASAFRTEIYRRLRRHWQFGNNLLLFAEIDNNVTFGVSVYGESGDIRFMNMCTIQHPSTVDDSLDHDGQGDIPGIQYPSGGWDIRPHASRLAIIDRHVLSEWAQLFDAPGTPASEARLLRPLTRDHIEILARLAQQPLRLVDLGYRWSSLWNEKTAREDGFIEWRTGHANSWSEVILQGPNFTAGNPLIREPNNPCKSNKDWSKIDLTCALDSVIPQTNYHRACDKNRYNSHIPQWDNRPATDYWRVAWRHMTQPGSERSLHAAIVPPGAAHVNTVYTLAIQDSAEKAAHINNVMAPTSLRRTALVAGLWVSLPLDYLVKVSGASKVNTEMIERFPTPFEHPCAPLLLLRILRLNCVTSDYAPLWSALFSEAFYSDSWTTSFSIQSRNLSSVGYEWTADTPLRSEFERRAALVEIDALAAIMLGLSSEQLALMFRAQFPVLRKYEHEMYFDSTGQKIAYEHHAQGVRQQKDDYKLLQALFRDEDHGDLLDRYTSFPPDESHNEPWFYKPDREAEMCSAYATFKQRLDLT